MTEQPRLVTDGDYARIYELTGDHIEDREARRIVLSTVSRLEGANRALHQDRAALMECLEKAAQAQPKALGYVRANGFVFDDIGSEPGNWKHLAFSLYSDLCEINADAESLLARLHEGSRGA